MKKTLSKTAMLLFTGMMSLTSAESMYNPLKSTVAIYNNKNYDKQVTYNREKGISVVQFYKADGKCFSLKVTSPTLLRRGIQERPRTVREVWH